MQLFPGLFFPEGGNIQNIHTHKKKALTKQNTFHILLLFCVNANIGKIHEYTRLYNIAQPYLAHVVLQSQAAGYNGSTVMAQLISVVQLTREAVCVDRGKDRMTAQHVFQCVAAVNTLDWFSNIRAIHMHHTSGSCSSE